MHDSGKLFLKIVSVVFIIFGVIAAVTSLIALISQRDGETAALTALFISSSIELVIGFLGFKKSDDPSQANFFVTSGFILVILMLLSMILGFSVWGLIGFLLPVMYIIGGYMLRIREA